MIKTIAVATVVAAALLVPVARRGQGRRKAAIVPAGDLKSTEDAKGSGGAGRRAVGRSEEGRERTSSSSFRPNFSAPLHHHTSDHYSVVLAGTMVFNFDGQDHTLPAGSYFFFTGQEAAHDPVPRSCGVHALRGYPGKWDVVPEKTPSK